MALPIQQKPKEYIDIKTGYGYSGIPKKGQIPVEVSKPDNKKSSSGRSSRSPIPTQQPSPISNIAAPQTKSQDAQKAQKDLASQNVNTARDAAQRDQNYLISTKLGTYDTKTKKYYNPNTGQEIGVEQSIKPKGFIEKSTSYFSEQKSRYETSRLRNDKPSLGKSIIGSIGAGVAVPIIGTIAFGSSLLTKPIQTVKSIPSSFGGTYQFIKSGGVAQTIRTNPGYSIGFLGGSYLSAKGVGKIGGLGTKGLQSINKAVNPNIISIEESGIKFVEGTTIPTKANKLLTYEGSKIDTIHTTISPKLKYGSELQSFPEMATGWRKELGQFNFYQSVPSSGKPVFYGGYVGIGQGGSSSITKFSLFEPKVKAFIFRGQEISETPSNIKSLGVKDIVRYQTSTPGTFVPGENIKGLSTEGQVITSVGKPGKPLFKIEKNPSGELYGKSTYYNVKKPTPSFLVGSPKLTRVYDILTSKNKKINFMESKLTQIDSGENFKKSRFKVDTKEILESKDTKYYSLSSTSSKLSPYIPVSSFSLSSNSPSKYKPSLSSGISSSVSKVVSPSIGSLPYSSPPSPPISSGGSGSKSTGYSMGSIGSSGGYSSSIPYGFSVPASIPSMDSSLINNKRKKGKKGGQWNISPSFTAIVKDIKMTNPLKVSKTFGVTPFQTRGLLVGKKSKGSYFKLTDL